ncbi:MAG: hypothetical protein WBX06_12605, partial [Acidobacteriaceae bacterium]
MRHVRSVAQPKVSPDGQQVLIQISDATADGGKSHLWLVDVKANTFRQLTFSPSADKRGESGGQWMPDGNSILFVARRGEHTQLFRLPMNGGEAHAFEVKIVPPVDESTAPDAIPPAKKPAAGADAAKPEPVECDIQRYFIAPDGKHIAILVRDPETPGEKKQDDEKADAVWVNHNLHGSRLYLLDPADGKITPTAVPPDVRGVSWAQQSDRLLAIAEGMNDAGDLSPDGTAWVLSVSDPAHPTQFKTAPATIGSAAWSTDGNHIFFTAQSQADAPPAYADLYELTLADGSIHNLSAGFDGSMGHDEPLADEGKVLESAELGTKTTLVRFDGDRHEALHFETATVSQFNTNAKHTAWVWLGSSSNQPPALFYSDKLGGTARTLSTPKLLPSDWTPVSSQLITWKSDAFTIEGLLYLPSQAAQH